ncbi:MAG: diguanylate cyclase [Chloroflexota bacterium]
MQTELVHEPRLDVPAAGAHPQAGAPANATLSPRWMTSAGVLGMVAAAVGYAVVAQVSLVFVTHPQNVAIIWPPAGIALGALLVTAPRRWPILLLALAVAAAGAHLNAGASLFVALGMALAHTLEALLGAVLLRRLGVTSLASVQGTGRFFVAAALGPPAVAGLIGSMVVVSAGGGPFIGAWVTWWLADAAGIMAITPLFLLRAGQLRLPGIGWTRMLEGASLELALLALTAVTFFAPTDAARLSSYPIFLLLVLASLRFGVAGAAVATFQVALIATAGTVLGHGPIAVLNPLLTWQIGQAQIFVAVVFLTAFVTAAAVAERRRAERIIEAQRMAAAERAATSDRLADFARQIAQTLDQEATYLQIAQAAMAVVPADIIQLTVAEARGGDHAVRAAIGAPGAVGQPIAVGDGIAGAVIRDRVAVINERSLPADRAGSLAGVLPLEPLAFVCAPMLRDGEVIATLGLARTDMSRPFTAHERDALAMMAELSAHAIGNVIEYAKVSDRSIRDELTGIPNRRYFNLAFEQLGALRERQAPGARPVIAAIMIDVDHFGAVNKERGHETGDRVLAALGSLLATRLRRADIVARYGGEEFIAILPGTGRTAAVRLADEIRYAFAGLEILGTDGEPIHCTVSAGVAEVAAGHGPLTDLLKTADVALIMAKRAGRNQVNAA